jgi:hypothetical protein
VIRIQGDGVAASSCSRLLGRAGLDVAMEKNGRSRIPALLVGDTTQALLRDVFEQNNIFNDVRRVSRRIVAWGGRESMDLPHSSVVISEQELIGRLQSPASALGGANPDWTIYTSRPLPQGADHNFGSRIAAASGARLRASAQRDACWIESLENGWLFLLPGWLLAVGATADELLADSRLIAAQIESLDAPAGQFPAYPRIYDPLCGPEWLACGGAAMAFDPICGDGIGNAVREAILASAVIKASARGEDCSGLRAHYQTRLLAGFLKHLELCRQFYAACSGEWWLSELAQLDAGIAWCRGQLGSRTKFRYQLRGFELEPVSSAAQTLS